jgi:predicted nuclease with TOPRIM domain
MKRSYYLLITTTLFFSLSACEMGVRTYPSESYGTYNPADRYDIATRIGNQQKRINIGIEKGDLTRNEVDMLQENLDHIRNEYSRMKSDGRLTQQEVDRLERDLEVNDRMIQDKRSNQIKRLYGPAPAPQHDHAKTTDFQSRIENQQGRIDKGVAKGDLTRREADILQDNLNQIRDEYSRMKADGRLTPGEADRLERDLDVNDRMIQDKRNNEIRRRK